MALAFLGLGFQSPGAADVSAPKANPDFQVVVDQKINLSQREIYRNALLWFYQNEGKRPIIAAHSGITPADIKKFRVFEVKDKDAGIIVGNGFRNLDVDPMFGAKIPFSFKMKIEIAEKQYRVTIMEVKTVNQVVRDQCLPLSGYALDKQEQARAVFRKLIQNLHADLKNHVTD